MKKRKPKIIKDPKLRGEWAESVFVERASGQGLAVSKPWGDSKTFDFVVGSPGHFVSVQVKSTMAEMGGGYGCTVKRNNKSYEPGSFDFVAAYVIPEDAWYIVPAGKCAGRATLILCSDSGEAKYEEYREAWHLLREASGISEGDQNEDDDIPTSRKGGETLRQAQGRLWGIPDENSPLKQSLNGAPAPDGAPGASETPASGIVVKRMQNAFSFFRKQLERDAPEK